MTPDELQTPPTEQEVAELFRSIGNSDLVDYERSILRRLAFDRDRLRQELDCIPEPIRREWREYKTGGAAVAPGG